MDGVGDYGAIGLGLATPDRGSSRELYSVDTNYQHIRGWTSLTHIHGRTIQRPPTSSAAPPAGAEAHAAALVRAWWHLSKGVSVAWVICGIDQEGARSTMMWRMIADIHTTYIIIARWNNGSASVACFAQHRPLPQPVSIKPFQTPHQIEASRRRPPRVRISHPAPLD